MSSQFCAGLKSEGFCTKTSQCALYRKWWEGPTWVDMVLCKFQKHDRYVPIHLEAATPQAIQSMPVGRTLDLFA
jgi:hypothetical protein